MRANVGVGLGPVRVSQRVGLPRSSNRQDERTDADKAIGSVILLVVVTGVWGGWDALLALFLWALVIVVAGGVLTALVAVVMLAARRLWRWGCR